MNKPKCAFCKKYIFKEKDIIKGRDTTIDIDMIVVSGFCVKCKKITILNVIDKCIAKDKQEVANVKTQGRGK